MNWWDFFAGAIVGSTVASGVGLALAMRVRRRDDDDRQISEQTRSEWIRERRDGE